MMNMKSVFWLKAMVVASLVVFLTGCDFFAQPEDDDEDPGLDIVELVADTDELSSLFTVIEYVDANGSQEDAADLAALLTGEGPFTVFAPTNSAFDAALDLDESGIFDTVDVGLLETAIGTAEATADALYTVVANHAVAGSVASTDLVDGQAITTVAGEAYPLGLSVDLDSGVDIYATFSAATVIGPDIPASNGIAHLVDTVLLDDATILALDGAGVDLGDNIVEIVVATESLSTLLTVIQYVDTNGSQDDTADLATILAADDSYTVFAPSNDAFDALDLDGEGDGFTGDVAALETTLGSATAAADALYLVVANHATNADEVLSIELTDGLEITTLAGSGEAYGLEIDLSTAVEVIPSDSSFTASVILADVQALNGVAHVIDTVLLDTATVAALNP